MDPTTPETPEPADAGSPFVRVPLVTTRIVPRPPATVGGPYVMDVAPTAATVRATTRLGRAVFNDLLAVIAAEERAEARVALRDVLARADGLVQLGALGPCALEPAALVELDEALAAGLSYTVEAPLTIGPLRLLGLLSAPKLASAGMILLNMATEHVHPDASLLMRTRRCGTLRQAYGEHSGHVTPAHVELLRELFAEVPDVTAYYSRDELQVDAWSTWRCTPKIAAAGETFRVGVRVDVLSGSLQDGELRVAPIVGNWAGSVIALRPVRLKYDRPTRTHQGRMTAEQRDELRDGIAEVVADLPTHLQHAIELWDRAAVRPLHELVAMDEPAVAAIIAAMQHAAKDATENRAPWSAVGPHAMELLDGVHRWFARSVGEAGAETLMLGMHFSPQAASGARDGRPMPTLGSLLNGVLLWAQQLNPAKAAQLERAAGRMLEDQATDRSPIYWLSAEEYSGPDVDPAHFTE